MKIDGLGVMCLAVRTHSNSEMTNQLNPSMCDESWKRGITFPVTFSKLHVISIWHESQQQLIKIYLQQRLCSDLSFSNVGQLNDRKPKESFQLLFCFVAKWTFCSNFGKRISVASMKWTFVTKNWFQSLVRSKFSSSKSCFEKQRRIEFNLKTFFSFKLYV